MSVSKGVINYPQAYKLSALAGLPWIFEIFSKKSHSGENCRTVPKKPYSISLYIEPNYTLSLYIEPNYTLFLNIEPNYTLS